MKKLTYFSARIFCTKGISSNNVSDLSWYLGLFLKKIVNKNTIMQVVSRDINTDRQTERGWWDALTKINEILYGNAFTSSKFLSILTSYLPVQVLSQKVTSIKLGSSSLLGRKSNYYMIYRTKQCYTIGVLLKTLGGSVLPGTENPYLVFRPKLATFDPISNQNVWFSTIFRPKFAIFNPISDLGTVELLLKMLLNLSIEKNSETNLKNFVLLCCYQHFLDSRQQHREYICL